MAVANYCITRVIIYPISYDTGISDLSIYLYIILINVYCDGASRGNPGDASIGVIAYTDSTKEKVLFTISKAIGKETNNVAEWTALLFALEKCLELGEKEISVYLDSELVVKQMNGVYKTKHPDLIDIKKKVDKHKLEFSKIEFIHIPREKNKEADKLANRALDE